MTEPQTSEEWVTFFHDQYLATLNPVHILAAYCYLQQTSPDILAVPSWISNHLAEGFNTYLTGLTSGRSITLEGALGIDEKSRIERTALDKMVDYVHLYQWLFDLKPGRAANAVYMKYRNSIKESRLDPKHQGLTRSKTSFIDFYSRNGGKKRHLAWVSRLAVKEPTDQDRDEELSFVDKDTANFIKNNSPHYPHR